MPNSHLTRFFVIMMGMALTQCQQDNAASAKHSPADQKASMFVDAGTDIKFENKNRRKWGAPVIADLDQDGFPELLLNDHGYAIKVYWNEKGKFGKGYDLIMGDTHGIAVADYNKDGNLELVVARGGGSGKNARNAKIYTVTKDRQFLDAAPLTVPLKNMRGRTANFFDGDSDGDLDLLLFGFASNSTAADAETYIYENDGTGDLAHHGALKKTGPDGEGLLVTDFNNDNVPDLLLYGGEDTLTAFLGSGDLSFTDVSEDILPAQLKHVTAIIEFDYDNDGDFDLYVSRGRDYEAGENVYDPTTQAFAFYTKRGPFQLPDLKIGETFVLENYQAPWPHQKIYTGEPGMDYPTPGEKHSGRDVQIVSSDALGWPDETDEKGLYFGYIGNYKWRVAGDTFSPTTGVIKGVKSFEAKDIKPGPNDVLLENRDGDFVDVTQQAGLYFEAHSSGVANADFNNDGYQDIFVVKRGNLATSNTQIVFLNNGDGTFSKKLNHGIISPELGAIGSEAAVIDYNLDGFVDVIYGNERGKWHLYRNASVEKEQAKHITLHVGSSPKDAMSARGAVVIVTACGQSQIQRIGSSGARYSQSINTNVHFGLGDCADSLQVNVRWSNGEVSDVNVAADITSVSIGQIEK